MRYTKLDRYNYDIFSGHIRIHLSDVNDPILVDIMSEINRSNGRIYVEGKRFLYSDTYQISGDYRQAYLDIGVQEVS